MTQWQKIFHARKFFYSVCIGLGNLFSSLSLLTCGQSIWAHYSLKIWVSLQTWKKRYPKCGVEKIGCKKLGLDFLIILKKKRGQAASSLFEYQKNFQTLFFATCFLQPILFILYFEPNIFKVPDHKKYQIDLIN